MCGIAGLVSPEPVGREQVAAMLETLEHRGPDDSGLWSSEDRRVAMGQRRLAIIDLSPLGRNPMSWDGGRLWVTFNGEIYNYRELRRELESGCAFRTQSDTEVILAAYDRWGTGCLKKFVGMFAFALWDTALGRLFLARDRLGKKPLYYSESDGRLLFASELKALLTDPNFSRNADPDAVSLYLRYGYVPAPLAIFRSARKLPPAHFALYQEGKLRIERYWDPISIALGGPLPLESEEAQERLDDLLKESVRLRMISDVPLGAFLSGGVDSSLVVALMQEQSSKPVRTFTISFEDREFDEADGARAVARHLGTEHHEETCTASEMLDSIEVLPDFFDEPFADSSAIPTHLVSKMTRRKVTVALSGDGGDELFFGYPRYSAYARSGWMLNAPRPAREAAASVLSRLPRRRFRRAAEVLRRGGSDVYSRFVTYWSEEEIFALSGRQAVAYPASVETLERIQTLPREQRPPLLDLVTYLPEDILTKVDRASMAASLEARSPLLDHRIVEFALRLPAELKWDGATSKVLLRRVLDRRVPRELLDRPKMGFGVPLADWFHGPLRPRMSDLLAGSRLYDLGLEPIPARKVWGEFLSGRSHRTDVLWNLFAFESWASRWLPAGVSRTKAVLSV